MLNIDTEYRELMRTARECNSCGYLVLHPLIYCPKCSGRLLPIIISKKEFLRKKDEYKKKENIENL